MRMSFSRINTYLACGERYRRRYPLKQKRPPGIALIRGKTFHEGARKNFKQKIQTGKDLPKSQILEIMDAAFDSIRKKEGYRLTRDEQAVGKNRTLATTRDNIRGLGEIFSDDFAPLIQPEWVDQEKTIKLPEVEIITYLDLATKSREVIEMKTSTKATSQKDVDKNMQLTIYSLIYRAITGDEPARLQLATFVMKSQPEVKPCYTSRTREDYEALVNVMNNAIENINKGAFPPNGLSTWKCDPRYCGYWYDCKYVNHSRPVFSIPKAKGGEQNAGSTKGQTGPGRPERVGRYRYQGTKLPDSF